MRRLALAATLVLAGLAAGAAPPAAAEAPAEAEREIAEARREVERIRAEIERLDRRIRDLQRQGADVQRRFRLADIEYRRKREEHRLHQARLRQVRREYDRERARVGALRETLSDRRGRLAERARALFQRTRRAEFEVLASAADLVDLRKRARFLEAIARADAALIDRTLRTKAEVEAAVERLAKKKAEMEEIREDLRRAEAALYGKRQRERTAVERTEAERREALRQKRELEQAVAELQALIRRYQERMRRVEGEARRGALAWPVRGRIFVPEAVASVLGGAYIEAPVGTPVRAAAAGEVIHVGALRGFGTTVLVGHEAGVVTVYGNLSSVSVSPGQKVREGSTIGATGTTQYGPALFFSIRSQNVAQDVRAWLGG